MLRRTAAQLYKCGSLRPQFNNNTMMISSFSQQQQKMMMMSTFQSIQQQFNNININNNKHMTQTNRLFAPLNASSPITHSAVTCTQQSLRMRRCAPKYSPAPRKLKTKTAAKKRFRITGGGKLKRRMAGKQHHAWSKNRARKNKLRQYKFVTNRSIYKRLTTMLNFK